MVISSEVINMDLYKIIKTYEVSEIEIYIVMCVINLEIIFSYFYDVNEYFLCGDINHSCLIPFIKIMKKSLETVKIGGTKINLTCM